MDEESDCEDLATSILIPRKKTSPSLVIVDKSQTQASILFISSVFLEVSKFLDVNDMLNLRSCCSSLNHLIDSSFRELRLVLEQLQRIYNGIAKVQSHYGLQHLLPDRSAEMLNSLYHQLTAEQHYSKLRNTFSKIESKSCTSLPVLFSFLIETGCTQQTPSHINKLRNVIDQHLEVTRFICAEIKAPKLRFQGANPFSLNAISIDSAVQLRNRDNQVVFFNLIYSYGFQTVANNAFEETCTIFASTSSVEAQQLLNIPSSHSTIVAHYGSSTAAGETKPDVVLSLGLDEKFFAKVACWIGLNINGIKMAHFLLWCLMGNKIRSYQPLAESRPLAINATVDARDNTPVEDWIRNNRFWTLSSLHWTRHVLHKAYCNRLFGDILSTSSVETKWRNIATKNIKILSNRYLNLFVGNEFCQNHSTEISVNTIKGKLLIGIYYYGMGYENPKPIAKMFLTPETPELSAFFGIPLKTQTDITNPNWKVLCAHLGLLMDGFDPSRPVDEVVQFHQVLKIAVASCQVISMSEKNGLLSANMDSVDLNNTPVFWETQLAENTLQYL